MITLIVNFSENSGNGNIHVNTSVLSNGTNGSVNSGAIGTARNVNGVKQTFTNTVGVASNFLKEMCLSDGDSEILTSLASGSTDAQILAQKDNEIADLKRRLEETANSLRTANSTSSTLRAENRELRQTALKLQAIVESGEVAEGIELPTLPVAAAPPEYVVLTGELLNNAIRNKEKLESRECCVCKNPLIAPTSAHESKIVCTRCEVPKSVDNVPF